MSFSYHKGGVNRPHFLGGQPAMVPMPPSVSAPNTTPLKPVFPPDVDRMDMMILTLHRTDPTPPATVSSGGLITFDDVAMAKVVAQGAAALPLLEKTLRQQSAVLTQPTMPIEQKQQVLLKALHTLRTAELLANSGVSIDSLYPALSTLDSIPNPLLTIYLAGAYSKLTRPEPLGWALMTLARLGTQQALGGVPTPHLQKAHEEVGKVVSFQLQKFPALAVQVMGWLQTFGSQTISGPLNLSTLKVH